MPSAPKWLFDTVELLMPNQPLAEITETKWLSPSVKKISFPGDFIKWNFSIGSYIDSRVTNTEVRRYTVSFAGAGDGVLELIVHLHGGRCGSNFMRNLEVGTQINMNKPRNDRRYYDATANRFVIFGDEISLGLARSFLSVLKKNNQNFQFIFKLTGENKNIPELIELENSIVFPRNGSFKDEDWIKNLLATQIPGWREANFVLTGNVKSAQTFRRVIKYLTTGKIYLHGYWLEGRKGL